MKILHLTFHSGSSSELSYIGKILNIEIITERFTDGITNNNAIYNVGHDRANNAWNKYKDYYNSFDAILTSDTAPIARTFLQNNFKKKLIVWVCNRFDYSDQASLDCDFPDKEFYDLFRKRYNTAQIISYTPFEHWYAQNMRQVCSWNNCIKPIGKLLDNNLEKSLIPINIDKSNIFFIPPYHNDTLFIDLSQKLNSLNIPNYRGRYAGSEDLKDFKGIIHIPYAWSNFALFENLQNNLIYFIPSKKFILELAQLNNFFWTPPITDKNIELAEWYCHDFRDAFVYFDSWDDLVIKVKTLDYIEKKQIIKRIMELHTIVMLKKWEIILLH